MNRALVTGGTGYIGSKLVIKLVEMGWSVAMLVRKGSSLTCIEKVMDTIMVYEVEENYSNLISIVIEIAPTTIFHLASQISCDESSEAIDLIINGNILFGAKLLNAAKISGVKYFINTGTYWQNYNDEEYNPVDLYAATKEAFEKILRYFVESSSMNVITLKLFDVYGPDDKRNKLIPSLISYSRENSLLKLTKCEQLIDLVYIDDVVDAYIAAISLMRNTNYKFRVYAVASGDLRPLKEVILIAKGLLGDKLNVLFGAKPYREREVMIPWRKYETLPNWKPKVDLIEGLSRCYFEHEKV